MQKNLFWFDSGGSPKWTAPGACDFPSLHGFAKFARLCQIRRALPFTCRASLAKGLSLHISVGFLGVKFCEGDLVPRLFPLSLGISPRVGDHKGVSSQGHCAQVSINREF